MLLYGIAIAALLLLLLLYVLDYKFRSPRFLRLVSRIPSLPEWPIIGSALIMNIPRDEVMDVIDYWYKATGPVFRFNVFGYHHVVLKHPDDIEKLLAGSKNIGKSHDYTLIKPWLQDGLLLSTGEKWHSRRKLLTPTFHFKILEDYIPILQSNSEKLVDILYSHVGAPHVDVHAVVALCTLDIICETAMGVSIGAQDGNERGYVDAIKQMSDCFQQRHMSPWLYRDTCFKLSPLHRKQSRLLGVLHGFTRKVIKERRQQYKMQQTQETAHKNSRKRRLAFLDLLIEMSEKGEDLKDKDIQEEVDTFMFEGHDTTTAAITWALYLLGRHPHIQEKVATEVAEVLGESRRPINLADLGRMKYLEQVIKESLRMYPSVPAISRTVDTDTTVRNFTVPKGCFISLLPYFLHNDERFYPEPYKFDPERFSPEACERRHPFSYIPFSAGQRGCIGQKFALMEEKVVLSTVLRNFQVESLDRPEDIKLLWQLILRSRDPLRLRFTPRT